MNEPTLNRRDLNRLALAALGGLSVRRVRSAAARRTPTRTRPRSRR